MQLTHRSNFMTKFTSFVVVYHPYPLSDLSLSISDSKEVGCTRKRCVGAYDRVNSIG